MKKSEIIQWLSNNWKEYVYEDRLSQSDLNKAVRRNLKIPDGTYYDYYINEAIDQLFYEIEKMGSLVILMY